MSDRYWIGGVSTDWSDPNNWSTTSGGSGGASVPGVNDSTIFDVNSSGNCNLTEAVSFSGINITSTFPHYFYDSGYDVNSYGDIQIIPTNAHFVSTSNWYQKNSHSGYATATSNYIWNYITDSGVTLTTTNYFHVKNAELGPHTVITGGAMQFIIIYPVNDQPLRPHHTTTFPQGLRFYVNTYDIQQSGMLPSNECTYFYIGYGASTGKSFILMSDMYVTNYMRVHAGNGAKTEAAARVFDCNGYNLYITYDLTLGSATTAYNGYAGKMKFGSGTHSIGRDLRMDYNPEPGLNTYGYIDWGTATVNIGRDLNLYKMDTVAGEPSHIVNMIGSTQADIFCSGQMPNINIAKDAGSLVRYIGNDTGVFDNLTISQGDFDFNGYTVSVSGDLITHGGRFWNGADYSMGGATVSVSGDIVLHGSGGYPLYVEDLNFVFNSPSVGRTRYCHAKNSIYAGDSYMDATHPTNVGYELPVSGWRFCDLYYPVETPVGKIMIKRVHNYA